MKSRASTLLDVVNQALFLLGQDPITNFESPDDDAGVKVKAMLYEAIDEAQQSFFWQELNVVEEITVDGTAHYTGLNRFALPDDCLRPLGAKMVSESGPDTGLEWMLQKNGPAYTIDGNWIVTSSDTMHLLYTKRQDDPAEWTPELLRVTYTLLASNAALYVTGSPDVSANLFQKLEQFTKPFAKRLQSKYVNADQWMPKGFTNLLARYS